MSSIAARLETRSPRLSFEGFREAVVALVFMCSFFTKIEPAPGDFLSILALCLFLRSGLHFSRYIAAPLLILIIYLACGIITCIPIERPQLEIYFTNPYQFSIGIAYTATAGVLVAAYIAADPLRRYLKIERAYWIGATIGSAIGLLMYFRVQPFFALNAIGDNSLGDYLYRVRGLYKDPNVFSTWLVLPFVTMLQALISGRLRAGLFSVTSLLLISSALLLAFSRGGWVDAAVSSTLMGLGIFAFAPTGKIRGRTVLLFAVGLVGAAVLLAGLLSIPSIRDAFQDRFVLVKSYDAGETGRFGNQLNSLPLLQTLPFGFGPYQFQQIFGEAPHNTFLNAFASAGWIGGISYLLLFCVNSAMLLKVAFTRSPYQAYGIAVGATFIVMTLQGLQIDNEHWRHLYWMMGIGWGLYAGLREHEPAVFSEKEIRDGWLPPHLLKGRG